MKRPDFSNLLAPNYHFIQAFEVHKTGSYIKLYWKWEGNQIMWMTSGFGKASKYPNLMDTTGIKRVY